MILLEQLQALADRWRAMAASVTPAQSNDDETRTALVCAALVDCSDDLQEVIDEHCG